MGEMKLKTPRYGVSIDGQDGVYRFRRLWAARQAFDTVALSADEPAAILSRSDPDGTLHVLAERHFEATSGGDED